MAPGPYNKPLGESSNSSSNNHGGDRLCLLKGVHRGGLPRVSSFTSGAPDRYQDINKTLLRAKSESFNNNNNNNNNNKNHDHQDTSSYYSSQGDDTGGRKWGLGRQNFGSERRGDEKHNTHTHNTEKDTCSLLLQEEEGERREEDAEGRRGKKKQEGCERREEEEEEDKGGKGGREKKPGPAKRMRDLAAFWLLGFCNNFTYWVMITAAYDLLSVQAQSYTERSQQSSLTSSFTNSQSGEVTVQLRTEVTSAWSNESAAASFVNTFKCLKHSTGAILIADTLPATALTLAAPLTLLVGVWMRVWVLAGLCVASYLTLGLASPSFIFLGVALASASRGFSDTTFLAHSSYYHKHVLSLWSSGTGVATFVGPLLYSLLTTVGLEPRHALLVFIVIPIIIVVSFSFILSHQKTPCRSSEDMEGQEDAAVLATVADQDMDDKNQKTWAIIKEKFFLFLRAQTYLMPLAVFYLIMYFTNQGLLELVYFPGSQLTHAQQYSWNNTVRCLGTLISRSSHKLLLLPSIWLYNIPLILILAMVGTEAHYHYLPSEYIILTLLFLQGLLEGGAFRATVFNIHKKASPEEREFCLGIFPSSLFFPAMVAGFVSIPTHEFLCRHHIYNQGH